MQVLKPEQKKFFDENGYLLIKQFYTPEQIGRMRDELHDLMTNIENQPKHLTYGFMDLPEGYDPDPSNPRNVTGIMNQTLANDYWFDQFTDPRVVSILVDLLGPDIDFHNGKVRNKPPGFYCDQSWHQDVRYIPHSRPDLAAVITYIDPTDVNAGATEVVPGSHRREWPTRDGLNVADAEVSEAKRQVVAAEAGDMLIIHVRILHRAGHNTTPRARHAVINQYKTLEAIDQWGNDCAFGGLPLARQGRSVMPRLVS